MKIYRPIFNLPFISNPSKAYRRTLTAHSDVHDRYQSAYRRGYSTETVLLKVHSDIAEALDEGSMTALITLDLAAAFDVIDHPIPLKRLESSFWHLGKGHNLGKIVHRRQKSTYFSR